MLKYFTPLLGLASNKGGDAADGCSCAQKTCSCCVELQVPLIMDKFCKFFYK